jgi:hypothetical protein
MNSQKFILGGLVGGILYFLLGYVVYGMLLKNFFDQNGMAVNMDNIVWWAMIVGNLAAGFLLAYILGKANVSSVVGGAGVGFIVGLLMGLSFDLTMYGIGHGLTSLQAVACDVAAGAVITAISGAGIGWVLGMSKKTVAAA